MTFELWSSGGVISARNLPKTCQPTEVHTMQALQWVWSLWMEEAPPNIVTRFKFEYHQHIQIESRTGYPIATPSQFKKHDRKIVRCCQLSLVPKAFPCHVRAASVKPIAEMPWQTRKISKIWKNMYNIQFLKLHCSTNKDCHCGYPLRLALLPVKAK